VDNPLDACGGVKPGYEESEVAGPVPYRHQKRRWDFRFHERKSSKVDIPRRPGGPIAECREQAEPEIGFVPTLFLGTGPLV